MAAAATSDPFVGSWRLNIEKSAYAPGRCPKSMTIEMTASGNGVHYRSEVEYSNGRKLKAEYTAEYNGAEAIVIGERGLQTPVMLKRIDANAVEAQYIRASRVVATARRVLSHDGRVMTITTVSKDPAGRDVTSVGVYDRTFR